MPELSEVDKRSAVASFVDKFGRESELSITGRLTLKAAMNGHGVT